VTAELPSPALAGSEDRPFVEVWPRDDHRDRMLRDLVVPSRWKFALVALYLSTGRHMPDEAKRHGCVFGFCDARGVQRPKVSATHIGWTVEPVRDSLPGCALIASTVDGACAHGRRDCAECEGLAYDRACLDGHDAAVAAPNRALLDKRAREDDDDGPWEPDRPPSCDWCGGKGCRFCDADDVVDRLLERQQLAAIDLPLDFAPGLRREEAEAIRTPHTTLKYVCTECGRETNGTWYATGRFACGTGLGCEGCGSFSLRFRNTCPGCGRGVEHCDAELEGSAWLMPLCVTRRSAAKGGAT
jgi:hypothetical protein